VVLGLLYFPAQTHFHVHAPKCDQLLPTLRLLVPLLQNYAYVALFAGFYWMSWVQFGRSDARGIWALLATLLVAALFELAEGMTGGGRGQVHCRVRDLVPDAAGAVGAALLLAIWSRLRRKPAYVRLVKPRAAAAPRPVAPPSRAYVPPRGVVPPPPPPPPPPRPRRFQREGSYLRPPTFHRAQALRLPRRTWLRRMRSRRGRGKRSLHVKPSFNSSRRSWDVFEQCHDACGRSYVDVAARSSLAASSWQLWAPGRS